MKIYYLLEQKTYRRNLQYRLAHILGNIAIFGYIMIFIWLDVMGEIKDMHLVEPDTEAAVAKLSKGGIVG